MHSIPGIRTAHDNFIFYWDSKDSEVGLYLVLTSNMGSSIKIGSLPIEKEHLFTNTVDWRSTGIAVTSLNVNFTGVSVSKGTQVKLGTLFYVIDS